MERSAKSGKGWSEEEEGRAGKGFLAWILGWVIGGTHWRTSSVNYGMELQCTLVVSLWSLQCRKKPCLGERWNATHACSGSSHAGEMHLTE